MRVVRPFPALVVRQGWAPHTVTALSDSLDAAATEPGRVTLDPAAYEEAEPALYVYRQRGETTSSIGLVCEVDTSAFADGRIRGHEAVHRDRVDALVRHQATTSGPPALVALLHHAGAAFTRTLAETLDTPPLLEFAADGGLQQSVWRVSSPELVDAVTTELSSVRHYIADGHHRVAAGLQEARPSTGLLCVVHAMDQLAVSAFHRRITGPVEEAAVLDLLAGDFEVTPATGPPAPGVGAFGLYVDGRWLRVVCHDDVVGTALDVEILQSRVLDRLATAGHAVEIVSARAPIAEHARRCDADQGALFTLAPPRLEVLTGLADAGGVMPPKTTYFEPKPCAGIFRRPLT